MLFVNVLRSASTPSAYSNVNHDKQDMCLPLFLAASLSSLQTAEKPPALLLVCGPSLRSSMDRPIPVKSRPGDLLGTPLTPGHLEREGEESRLLILSLHRHSRTSGLF